MSVQVMGAVWNLRGLSANEKLVLLALADHANHDGSEAHPGNALLEQKTDLSERAIQYILGRLKERGLIIPEPGPTGRGHRASYNLSPVLKGARVAPIKTTKDANTCTLSFSEGCKVCTFSALERVQIATLKGANRDIAYIEQPSLTVLKQETRARDPENDLSPQLTPFEEALLEVCRYNPDRLDPKTWAEMKAAARKLEGETPDRARLFGSEWLRQKPGFSPPTMTQVWREWDRVLPKCESPKPRAPAGPPASREQALAELRKLVGKESNGTG